ncbi:response regulator transcription factor [Clostridium scatologenes]|uniref:Stage 0 sporulation protein A homolog n=1 Tax=Clostridium scatologenes TaxID=1548 RepID=A0A0E3M6Y1_CLOSL|nr:response regulator transcription factor [Clostridium scatologenes]AKA69744.1 two-component response regulator [Clostridium scatologenes]
MRILVVEDDKSILQSIRNSLNKYYTIDSASDGEDGLYMAQQNIYDTIILDIMLPNLSGDRILKTIRQEGIYTPVLFLTAKDSLEDKIKGFKMGADDYIVKPFYIEELKIRIDALLRRSGALISQNILKCGILELNTKSRELLISGEKVELQTKLFDILEYLINNKDSIITKEQIFHRIWGFESDTTINIVEVYIHKLRKMLEQHGCYNCIKTVRGVGYMFKIDEENKCLKN